MVRLYDMKRDIYKNIIPQLSNTVKSGIYIISPTDIEKDPNKKIYCKIGRSTDLKKRLNQYHLCYPLGFHVYALLYIHTKGRTKNQLIVHNLDMEIEIHHYFREHQLKTTMRGFNEWFNISYNEILNCLKDFRKSFDIVRPFKGSSSVIDAFVDDISHEKLGKQALNDNEALKDYLENLNSDLLSELLADPEKQEALLEWSANGIDDKLEEYKHDEEHETHKVEIKNEKKIKCSDCGYERWESRFTQDGKQYKTCNPCRLKRRNRTSRKKNK